MKLALVYDKDDHKLQKDSYSGIYRGMMLALVNRFEEVLPVHNDCPASDLEGCDAIVFYDPQSVHHIQIKGVESLSAVRMEYMTDPHQEEVKGVYRQFDKFVHKLNAGQRLARAKERGIDFIISPVRDGYYKYFEPILKGDAEKMLFWFPVAPAFPKYEDSITTRKVAVLGNGAIWDGGLGCYNFRKWAFRQDCITRVPHWIEDPDTPYGEDFHKLLSYFAGALALSEFYPVNKYYEIPAAGCLCFAQHHQEYEDLGFVGYKSCIYVTRENFAYRIKDFLSRPERYEDIAIAGRELMQNNYMAPHFADTVYNKVREVLCPTVQQVERLR